MRKLLLILLAFTASLASAQSLGVGVANGGTVLTPPGVKWGGKLIVNFTSGCSWNSSTLMVDCSFGAGLTNPMTTSGDIITGGAAGAAQRLATNTTATIKYLQSVSSGVPSWQQPLLSHLGNPGANTALDMTTRTLNFNYTGNWGSGFGFSVTSNGSNASTGPLFQLSTGAATTHDVFQACALGTTDCIKFTSGASLTAIGAATIDASKVSGTFTVVTSPVVNATTGFRVANAATIGNVLRGNGTNFVSAQLAYTDLSSLPQLAVNTTATAHNFFTAYNSTTGAFTKAQPACADLSDVTAFCNMANTAGGDLSGTFPSPTVAKVNGTSVTSGPAADTLLRTSALNTASWTAIPNCGDATHALAYNTTTHVLSCQAITATASPGGSNTQMQYNNAGALGGDTGCTTNGTGTLTCVSFVTSGTSADIFTEIAAPASPSAGTGAVWFDSSDHMLHSKSSGGTIGTTVTADTGAGNNFLTAISSAGAISKARPTCANLSDSSGGCTMSTTATGDVSGTLPAHTVIQVHPTRTAVNFAASPYTVLAGDANIDCDASGGAVALTLPAATGGHRELTVKKTDSSANACTLNRAGADTIDGATSVAISKQYAAVKLYDNASTTWDRLHVNQLGGDLSGTNVAATVLAVNGTTVPTNAAADQVLGTTGSATGAWASVPNCGDSSHGLAYNTSTHAFACQSITGSAGGVADPGGNGVMVRTALNTTAARTITGTANRLAVTNGDGTAGNPTLDIGANVPTMAAVGGAGNLLQTAAADRAVSDAGVAVANLATMAANGSAGNLLQTAAANKAVSDAGIAVANVVTAASNATAAKQLAIAGGANKTTSYIDFPAVGIIPAANCNNATAGAGWSIPATGVTPTCRAGSNNLGGALQMTPSAATGVAQFEYELPGDWDTAVKPYIAIYYGSGSNTTGTVIWTVSTGCTKQDGSVTDDPAWIAESAMGTQTMAAASRMWAQNAQLAGAMTNCIAGSTMFVKVAATGTASSAINVYKAVITVPRLLTVQAN